MLCNDTYEQTPQTKRLWHASIRSSRSVLIGGVLLLLSQISAAQSLVEESPFLKMQFAHQQQLREMYLHHHENATGARGDTGLTLLGRWAWGPCQAVAVSGNYAYIGNGSIFQVLDISIDTIPRVIAEYLTSGPTDVQLRDSLAFVCAGESLLVMNIADPERPTRIGWITFLAGAE
ncbi:MAG: hypothetical protein HY708_03520, partial [Ignavibacteriae bacterium]|nr:hypothetical protein [Ignavibacteriota bacterium]